MTFFSLQTWSLRCAFLVLGLCVAACSDGGPSAEKSDEDYTAYTLEDLQELANTGRHDEMFSIIANRRRLEVAGPDELRLALTVSLQKLDGISAEVFIERLIEKGVPAQELYIPKARALFLQGRLTDALAALEAKDLGTEKKIEAYLLQADIAGLNGKSELQVSLYQRAIEESPDDYRGYLGLALHEFEQTRLDTAEEYAAKALARGEQDPIVNYAVGAVALYKGDLDKARKFLEASASLRPGNAAALTELANLYIQQDDLDKAEQTLDKIFAVAPDNRMARYLSAQILAKRDKLQEAEKQFILMGEFSRTHLPASRTYGLVSYNLGKYAVASRYLERFLAAVPTDRNVRLALVDSLTKQTKAAEAMAYLEPILQETPDDIDANLYAAAAMAVAGNTEKSATHYEKALALMEAGENPDPVQTRLVKAKIAVSRFLAGDSKAATGQLQALHADQQGDFETLVLLANIHLRRYDHDGLLAVLEQMDTARPDSAEGFNFRGILAYRTGDLDGAIAAYSRALDQNPTYFSALKNRGLALLAAKQTEKAQQDLLQAVAMNPDDGQVQAFLGRSYLELKQFETASVHLMEAEAALPRSPLVLLDHSESLAGRGLLLLAIKKAKEARQYADGQKDLEDYIDDLLAGWEETVAGREAVKAADEARRRAEKDQKASQN